MGQQEIRLMTWKSRGSQSNMMIRPSEKLVLLFPLNLKPKTLLIASHLRTANPNPHLLPTNHRQTQIPVLVLILNQIRMMMMNQTIDRDSMETSDQILVVTYLPRPHTMAMPILTQQQLQPFPNLYYLYQPIPLPLGTRLFMLGTRSGQPVLP